MNEVGAPAHFVLPRVQWEVTSLNALIGIHKIDHLITTNVTSSCLKDWYMKRRFLAFDSLIQTLLISTTIITRTSSTINNQTFPSSRQLTTNNHNPFLPETLPMPQPQTNIFGTRTPVYWKCCCCKTKNLISYSDGYPVENSTRCGRCQGAFTTVEGCACCRGKSDVRYAFWGQCEGEGEGEWGT